MSESESKVYLNGVPVDHPHENHHHVSPIWEFSVVFGALLFLTILTYAVSFAGLGPASLPVAMVVATIKGALVVGFFMHLKYEDRFYSFLFMCTVMFISIFFTFVLFDMKTSGDLNEESGIGYKRDVDDSAQQADRDLAAAEAAARAQAPAAPAAPAAAAHSGGH